MTRLAAVLTLLAGLVLPAIPATAQGPRCDLDTYVSLVGVDTNRGEVLLSVRGASDEPATLILWRLAEETARWTPDLPPGRFGGSVGPGPLMALTRCGQGCLQSVRFYRGSWQALGEPISGPSASTAHLTYSGDGAPWLVLHGAAEREGHVTAWAFRLDGREWRARGRAEVTAVGAPGAGAAPWDDSAIVSGNGLFVADGSPRRWLESVPTDAEASGASLLPLVSPSGPRRPDDRRRAVLVTGEGLVYRTVDGGSSWRRSLWTPWNTGTAEPWRRGADYLIDIPLGPPSEELPALWFDRRFDDRERVLVTAMTPLGDWRVEATLPADLPTSAGRELEVLHTLRSPTGAITLLFGCVTSGGQPMLVARDLSGPRKDDGPRLVRIRPFE